MLRSCLLFNYSNTTNSLPILINLRAELTVPSLVIVFATFFLAGVILVALISSKYYKSSNAIFYFNLTVADAIMAFLGISVLVIPNSESWLIEKIAWVLFVLRSVWSLSVLCLTINRYRIINGKPGYSISTTSFLIAIIWAQSTLIAAFWYLLSPGAPWYYLHHNTTIAGVVLENLLVLVFALPVPLVLILLMLTSFKAKQHLSRIAGDGNTLSAVASQQIEGDLRLLLAFGVVYIMGFGFMFVVSINQLINLGGAVNVLPYWQKDETFCVYMIAFEQICDMIINFSNSLIIVQSRHVRGALKRTYRATSRVVRNITRCRGENREALILGEDHVESA